MSIYAGLDLNDKTTHVCVVDAEGKVLRGLRRLGQAAV